MVIANRVRGGPLHVAQATIALICGIERNPTCDGTLRFDAEIKAILMRWGWLAEVRCLVKILKVLSDHFPS
jgi:hypothetical protein